MQTNALKRHEPADKIVTDDLRPYPGVMKDLGNLKLRRPAAFAEWQLLMG